MRPKTDKDSKTLVRKIIRQWVDEFGRTHTETKWEEITTPVNLGSIKKPNQEIVEIRFDTRGKPQDIGDMFTRAFGG